MPAAALNASAPIVEAALRADYRALLDDAWARHLAPRGERAPVAVSLFAGAGGSALGMSMAGFRLALAVELDAHAASCLALNFPETAILRGDLRGMPAGLLLELAGTPRGRLDLLEASPPCQGFSRAGRRRSADPRNQLLHETLRFVEGFKPKALVMENVDSLLHAPGRGQFAPFFSALRALGYRAGAWILDAARYNVPQRRRRCLLLALRRDVAPGARLLPPLPCSWPRPVCAAIGDLPPAPAPAIGHLWVDESPQGRNTATWRLAAAAPQGARYAGHQRRLRWDAPAPTLTACHDGRRDKRPYLRNSHCHPLATRTLSPAEYRRLASFPDGFRFAGHDCPETWHRSMSRVGNAVPPLFMYAVALQLRRLLAGGHAHV